MLVFLENIHILLFLWLYNMHMCCCCFIKYTYAVFLVFIKCISAVGVLENIYIAVFVLYKMHKLLLLSYKYTCYCCDFDKLYMLLYCWRLCDCITTGGASFACLGSLGVGLVLGVALVLWYRIGNGCSFSPYRITIMVLCFNNGVIKLLVS